MQEIDAALILEGRHYQMAPYRIILMDHLLLIREGIKTIISNIPGLEVIGDVANGIELRKLLEGCAPDMIIINTTIPGVSATEVARDIQAKCPEMKLIFLSTSKSPESLSAALKIGVNGYLLKEDSSRELLDAIKTVRNGQVYISPKVTRQQPSDDNPPALHEGLNVPYDPLTDRERQVLSLVAEGKTDHQIADQLSIKLRTVQRHRFNIRTKLNFKHTADLVKYAIAMGYVRPSEDRPSPTNDYLFPWE
ncbi:MAG: DNA-binding response regulator [Desulfobacteraceae bacterium]|nr:MAG: DNA-binding response regulator [Desulfobacteraceae bacterium]